MQPGCRGGLCRVRAATDISESPVETGPRGAVGCVEANSAYCGRRRLPTHPEPYVTAENAERREEMIRLLLRDYQARGAHRETLGERNHGAVNPFTGAPSSICMTQRATSASSTAPQSRSIGPHSSGRCDLSICTRGGSVGRSGRPGKLVRYW
eukprot:5177828-Prymnesium_polylepis.2